MTLLLVCLRVFLQEPLHWNSVGYCPFACHRTEMMKFPLFLAVENVSTLFPLVCSNQLWLWSAVETSCGSNNKCKPRHWHQHQFVCLVAERTALALSCVRNLLGLGGWLVQLQNPHCCIWSQRWQVARHGHLLPINSAWLRRVLEADILGA